MKTKSQVRTCVILIVLLYIACILMIIPASVLGDTVETDTGSRTSSRAAPVIEKVGQITVTSGNVTINGLEDKEISILVTATDIDGDQLVFNDNAPFFDISAGIKEGNKWIGNITFTPTNENVGIHEVTVFVREVKTTNPLQNSVDVIFDIKNTNDAPVFKTIEDFSVDQDTPITVNITATDDDGIHGELESLTFDNNLITVVAGIEEGINYKFEPGHEADSKLWTVKFWFKPDNTMIGTHEVRFTVKDSKEERVDQYVNITVKNVNDPPETPEIVNPTTSLFFSNSQIIFKGRCDDQDLDVEGFGEELNFTWTTFYKSETTTLGYGEDLRVPGLEIGNHTVTLTVTDKAGEQSSTSIDLTIKSLFQLTKEDAQKSFSDEKLDLLLFKSTDGVRFTSSLSQNYPWVDIVKLESRMDGIDLVVTMTLQGNIRNATGNNYYVHIVKFSHEEKALDLTSESLPEFYSPASSDIYHTFFFEGGKGFVNKVGKDESYRIYDDTKIEFRIRITYLESIAGMPRDFGIFAITRYSSQSGALTGDYQYTYDAIGTGNVPATVAPYQPPKDEEGLLDQPIFLAVIAVIIIIVLAIVAIILMKRRKDAKDLIAPPSYDYKFVSGFQDQQQYESLYGSGKTQTQFQPPMMPMGPGMQPGMMPPQMRGPGPGMPMGPGMPPQAGSIPPGGGRGMTCPKCGKAIVLGMTKCPYCRQAL